MSICGKNPADLILFIKLTVLQLKIKEEINPSDLQILMTRAVEILNVLPWNKITT